MQFHNLKLTVLLGLSAPSSKNDQNMSFGKQQQSLLSTTATAQTKMKG